MDDKRIFDEVNAFASLRQIIEWSLSQTPRADFVDVVVQDEFHHDVIVRVTTDCFLAFETS